MQNLKVDPNSVKERPLKGLGRDELNIAEFPITLLTDEAPPDVKTLTFRDQIVDRGETVNRSVTITGSDKYGLPRPVDMDVLLCLIQLTKKENDFSKPEVSFNRGDILKLMGLIDSGKNYARIDESLRRWLGVTLYYDKSWWNKEQERWSTPVQEGFHILEHISLVDRKARQRRKAEVADDQIEMFKSSFTWNKIFLQSCQADNLKYLDMDVYFSLKRAITKQMYRFLDKRFYRNAVWTFDLKQFAFEHVGISRKYDTNKIKERLQPAFDELEAIDFLEASGNADRYQKQGKSWKIRLIHKQATEAGQPEPPQPILEPPLIVIELTKRGITKKSALDLATRHQAEGITAKIEVFDWLVAKTDKRVAKSPAGYLVKSINDDYALPKGYVSQAERERHRQAQQAEDDRLAASRRADRAADARDQAIKVKIVTYRQSLNVEQLAQVEAEAIAAASDELRESLDSPAMRLFRKTLISRMIDDHLSRTLEDA